VVEEALQILEEACEDPLYLVRPLHLSLFPCSPVESLAVADGLHVCVCPGGADQQAPAAAVDGRCKPSAHVAVRLPSSVSPSVSCLFCCVVDSERR
jgi:hypothetical protein